MARTSPISSLKQTLTFRFERLLGRGPFYRVLAIFSLILVIAILGGTLAWLLPGKEFDGIGDAFWWAFLRLSDPGYLVEEDDPGGRLLAVLLTVLGLAIFVGALIAIITQWLSDFLDRLALGMTPVRMNDHVVVLGWTNRSLELTASLVHAGDRFRPPKVALMVDRITDELVHEVETRVGAKNYRRRVIIRSGDPRQVGHLTRVDCAHARAIVLPSDAASADGPRQRDADTLRIIASLRSNSFSEGAPRPRLAIELSDPDMLEIASATYPGETHIVASNVLIGRSLGIAVMSPGLSFLMADLFDAREGSTFVTMQLPQLAGETLRQAETRFDKAVLLGVLSREDDDDPSRIRIGSNDVLEADDRILFLAPNDDPIEPGESHAIGSDDTLATDVAALRQLPSMRILILGWNGKVKHLLAELGGQPSGGMTVDIVSSTDAAMRSAALDQQMGLENLRIEQIEGSPRSAVFFEHHELAGYDVVVMLASDRHADTNSIESNTVANYCALEYALRGVSPRPHVILELVHPDSESLFESRDVEILTTPTLVADTLGGIVTHPDLLPMIRGLLRGDFGTVRTVEIDRLVDISREVDLHQFQSRLRNAGIVLLGLQRPASGLELELAPDKSRAMQFEPGDRAVLVMMS